MKHIEMDPLKAQALKRRKERSKARVKRDQYGISNYGWMRGAVYSIFANKIANNPELCVRHHVPKFTIEKDAVHKLAVVISACHENICKRYRNSIDMWRFGRLSLAPAAKCWEFSMDEELANHCLNYAEKPLYLLQQQQQQQQQSTTKSK